MEWIGSKCYNDKGRNVGKIWPDDGEWRAFEGCVELGGYKDEASAKAAVENAIAYENLTVKNVIGGLVCWAVIVWVLFEAIRCAILH